MSTPQEQEWILVQRFQRIMAAPMGIHLAVPPEREARADQAIARCFAWFAEVGARLTRFTVDSELSQLNAAGGEWRAVSPLLFEVVEQSVAAAQATNGLFDPGLLPVLEALGYDRDFAEIAYREAPRGEEGAAPPVASAGYWREIAFDRAQRRLRLPPGLRLDLGGIVKGWVADRALDRHFADFPNVLIDAGGDVRARGGAQPGESWAIGIGDPRTGMHEQEQPIRDVAVLTLGRGGLATSGATMRWWYREGQRQHHLIDPRTGRPAAVWIGNGDEGDEGRDASADGARVATATALAPSAAHAEVAAKAALLRGYPEALRAVEQAWAGAGSGAGVAGDPASAPAFEDSAVALLLVLGSGAVACSANLQDYLTTLGGGGELWLD